LKTKQNERSMKSIKENTKFIEIELNIESVFKLFKLTERSKSFDKRDSAKIANEFSRLVVNRINKQKLYNLGEEVYFYLTYQDSYNIGELTFCTEYNAKSNNMFFSIKEISFSDYKNWEVKDVQYIPLNYSQIVNRNGNL